MKTMIDKYMILINKIRSYKTKNKIDKFFTKFFLNREKNRFLKELKNIEEFNRDILMHIAWIIENEKTNLYIEDPITYGFYANYYTDTAIFAYNNDIINIRIHCSRSSNFMNIVVEYKRDNLDANKKEIKSYNIVKNKISKYDNKDILTNIFSIMNECICNDIETYIDYEIERIDR